MQSFCHLSWPTGTSHRDFSNILLLSLCKSCVINRLNCSTTSKIHVAQDVLINGYIFFEHVTHVKSFILACNWFDLNFGA